LITLWNKYLPVEALLMDSGKQKEDLNPTLKASVASLSLPMARLAISLSPDPYKK
jgi:hypothetical protein